MCKKNPSDFFLYIYIYIHTHTHDKGYTQYITEPSDTITHIIFFFDMSTQEGEEDSN
jgi:hypothetical protein